MQRSTIDRIYKWNFILSPLVITLLSVLQHFLYDLLPWFVVAWFAPVSESPAEHLKIVFYPTLIWWGITFLLFRKSREIRVCKWFSATFLASLIVVGMVTMLYSTIFFGLSEREGGLFLHVLIEIGSIVFAQWLGSHVYNYGRENKKLLLALGIINVVIVVLMAVFSFHPPEVAFFISK